MRNFHLPQNTVVAGVGVDHEQLVSLVQEFFVEKKTPIWEQNTDIVDMKKEADRSISQYTGGKVYVSFDFAESWIKHDICT